MTILPVNNSILNSVTYILYSDDVDYCVLVDCGEWEVLYPILNELGKTVKTVLLTHGHLDHIYGLNGLLKEQPWVEVCTLDCGHVEIQNSKKNLSFYYGYPFVIEDYQQKVLQHGEVLHFEGLADIEVIASPGHDSSCLTYKAERELFTGDAYIIDIKTFTKFPRGNKELALKSIALLSEMEKKGYNIHCGHHSYEMMAKVKE